jgi:hypothetical protein
MILLLSTSQVAGITGVSQHTHLGIYLCLWNHMHTHTHTHTHIHTHTHTRISANGEKKQREC